MANASNTPVPSKSRAMPDTKVVPGGAFRFTPSTGQRVSPGGAAVAFAARKGAAATVEADGPGREACPPSAEEAARPAPDSMEYGT
jgi:hypothetical protein